MGKRALREAGVWRVEVSPATPSTENVFLHVLSVTGDAAQHDAVQALLMVSASCHGAIVVDHDGEQSTMVLFRKMGATLDETFDLGGKPSFEGLLVVGLVPDQGYLVERTATHLTIRRDSAGLVVASDQATTYID